MHMRQEKNNKKGSYTGEKSSTEKLKKEISSEPDIQKIKSKMHEYTKHGLEEYATNKIAKLENKANETKVIAKKGKEEIQKIVPENTKLVKEMEKETAVVAKQAEEAVVESEKEFKVVADDNAESPSAGTSYEERLRNLGETLNIDIEDSASQIQKERDVKYAHLNEEIEKMEKLKKVEQKK